MKTVLISILAALFVISAQAVTVTNDGQVITVTTLEDQAAATRDTDVTTAWAGDVVAEDDLVSTDDLVVGDDASVAGDLVVAGAASAADVTATDDLVVGDDASVAGDLVVTGSVTAASATMSGAASAASLSIVGTATGSLQVIEQGSGTNALVFISGGVTNVIDADLAN